MGAAWASGINLYATLLVLGLSASTGSLVLPPELAFLSSPMVVGAAGLMYCVEFFADKMPGVDTGWDTIHTFVRIPAGAMLAAGAIGDAGPALEISAAILGGGMATITHTTKAGSRVLINTSPEPFTNWGASIGEDVAVFAGLWAALNHPVIFAIFLVVFIIFVAWLLPKILRGIKKVFGFIISIFKGKDAKKDMSQAKTDKEMKNKYKQIKKLKELLDSKAITKEEFEEQKKRLLNS